MARELLRYRSVDDLYEDWLDRIAELVSAAGGSPAPSLSLPRPTPAAGDVAHGAPPPPLHRDGALAPRRPPGVTHRAGRPREKKEATKKSLGREKTPLRSLRHHGKTACCLRR